MKLAVVLAAAFLAGCVSPGARQPQRFYVLEDVAKTYQAKSARSAVLLVAPTTAAGFYDTQDIAYSRAPGTRAYYHYHRWTELPARRIGELLAARLEKSGGFRMVASLTSPVRTIRLPSERPAPNSISVPQSMAEKSPGDNENSRRRQLVGNRNNSTGAIRATISSGT